MKFAFLRRIYLNNQKLSFFPFKDSSGKPVQRMFLNPAITPMFNLNNPAFRIFDYDRENFGIKDIRFVFKILSWGFSLLQSQLVFFIYLKDLLC